MYGKCGYEVQVQVAWISKVVLLDVEGWNQPVEVGKEKDHLVKSGWPNVPSKHEGCDYGQVSMTRGDPHWFGHDLVEGEPGIGNPARCRRWEQEYRSAPSRRPPKFAKGDGQQEDKTDKGTPPTGSMFHGQFDQLRLSKVRPFVMSKEMRSV